MVNRHLLFNCGRRHEILADDCLGRSQLYSAPEFGLLGSCKLFGIQIANCAISLVIKSLNKNNRWSQNSTTEVLSCARFFSFLLKVYSFLRKLYIRKVAQATLRILKGVVSR